MEMRNPFMPFIDDFEPEAEKFLVHYGYADAILNPMPIPVRDLIEKRIALSVIESEKLSSDNSTQGIIAFSDGIIQVYDDEENAYVGLKLETPAILIDADILNDAYKNQLLMHEAFHWYKHRSYFLYRKQHDLGYEFAFRCNTKYATGQIDVHWSDEQRMEWQTRKIVPMILLPKQAFLKKVCKVIGTNNAEELLRASISTAQIAEIASFFKVTQYLVRKRLKDLGCLVEKCDAVQAFSSQAVIRQSNMHVHQTTPFISLQEAFALYQSSHKFRDYLDTGLFEYRNNHFCTVIQKQDDNSANHLLFSEVLMPVETYTRQDDVMFHGDQHYEAKKIFRDTPQNLAVMDQISQLKAQFLNIHNRQASRARTTNEVLWEYMQDAHWNTSTFQSKTLLSPMDFTRIQKKDHTFKLPAYMAMAVGLGLALTEFQDAIRLSGMCLVRGDTLHDAYSFILSTMQGCDIDYCNDFLLSVGLQILGTHERDSNWNK